MAQLHQTTRSISIDLMDHLQRRWNAVILSGKPNGLAEKPDLLASLNQIGDEFGHLRSELIDALGDAANHKASIDLGTRAQIAVDILIRNLFERTADVGFLAEDQAITDSLIQGDAAETEMLQRRLQDYVAKYSVYDDIAIYRPDGSLHVTLLDAGSRFRPHEAFVENAVIEAQKFHEIFHGDVDGSAQLLYTQAIKGPTGSKAIGVLALSFRFADEMDSIFADLMAGATPDVILGIVDSHGYLIASNSPSLLPSGQLLNLEAGQLQEVSIDNRRWRGLRVPTRGYQGFHGLGWSGIGLQPVAANHTDDDDAPSEMAGEEIEREIAKSVIVSPGLRRISNRAYAIDTDLHLVGLNGKIAADRESNRVLPAVLASVREVGEHIRNAIHHVVSDLYRQSHRQLQRKAAQMAALGVNIMDRNLYERANDCRWWALTPFFRQCLAQYEDAALMSPADRDEIGRMLAYINDLYTVYHNLLVFDRHKRVIAESRPSGITGQQLSGQFISAALQNFDPQRYTVSAFEATPLYGDRPTYIYCGTILSPNGREAIGGIAIVFDGEPQFKQMLRDVMPLREDDSAYDDSYALFVNQAGIVIASTDDEHLPGTTLKNEDARSNGIQHEATSQGYREFKRRDGYKDDVCCRIIIAT
jgi:hypothetical protein